MGNVNGREDGNNSPSGIEEEETRANSALEAMAAPMGHSPPHSPTSTHSPLMFTPQRCGKDFTIMKVLPSGVYQYRFIVDGQWRYAPDLPWAQDGTGNANNILDLQDYVPEDIESISSFEPPLSPESSYSNLPLGAEDFAKEPPLVPPHVQLPLLNLPASHMEIPPPLSRPKHVILNHLYIQKGKNGQPVVALGSTHRFRAKYVTVVLYKPVQR
ncbi:hypothetical protein E1A91_D06G259400v1 [Gossypium mustelinum]|uniref:Association with the SNF1 complex (ASC) domain-containing protein n=1 Tax=Gossypium mustelinum TaxID=34275 RepID=A0A5D2UMZ5_GOSMU|nr:hypothetical protein E1A91_D06G259400v1 [Gossypium mustelinum]